MDLRPATPDDAETVADIWYRGWQDGHLGNVPDELVAIRTEETFHTRASDRVGDTTVATVDGAVAGFVMVVDDEVEQVYVDTAHRGSGVATTLLAEAERRVKRERPRPGLAGRRRRQRESAAVLRTSRLEGRRLLRLSRRHGAGHLSGALPPLRQAGLATSARRR